MVTISGVKVSHLDKKGLEVAEEQKVIKLNLNLNLTKAIAIKTEPGKKEKSTLIRDLDIDKVGEIVTMNGRVVKIESFEDQKLRIITIKQSDKKIIEINFWIHGTEYHRNLSSIEIKKAYKINGLHVSKNGEDEFKLTSSFYSVITELQLK